MMLLVDVEPRFSAVQVLEHPWVNVSGSPFPWVTPCVPWSDCGSAHVVPASRECWVGVCPPAPVNMPEPLLAPREQEQAPTLLTGALHEALHLTQRTRPPTGEGHAIASPRPPPPQLSFWAPIRAEPVNQVEQVPWAGAAWAAFLPRTQGAQGLGVGLGVLLRGGSSQTGPGTPAARRSLRCRFTAADVKRCAPKSSQMPPPHHTSTRSGDASGAGRGSFRAESLVSGPARDGQSSFRKVTAAVVIAQSVPILSALRTGSGSVLAGSCAAVPPTGTGGGA